MSRLLLTGITTSGALQVLGSAVRCGGETQNFVATGPRPRHRRWLAMLLILVSVLAMGGVVLRTGWVGFRTEEGTEVHGIALGMTPREVRERFKTAVPGQWRFVAGDDPALEWLPSGPSSVERARFEFHGGMLVAVRLLLSAADPAAQGARLGVSTASVLARRGLTDGRVELVLLARDCPTHAEEVGRLLTGGGAAAAN